MTINEPHHPAAAAARKPYSRPALQRTAPLRGAGQLYRSAEGPGSALGGVPLSSAEDAVVAAVRMGYRVAQNQIDRAGHIGERLRRAGERAVGAEPEAQAVDATERLVNKAVLSGLEWLEGLAAEPGSPWRRYATAQYKLLGALLGLKADAQPDTPSAAVPATPRPASKPTLVSAGAGIRIFHGGKAGRPLRVLRQHMDRLPGTGTFELRFHGPHGTDQLLEADLVVAEDRPPVLLFKNNSACPAGTWAAAVCSPDQHEQLGWIEIEQM